MKSQLNDFVLRGLYARHCIRDLQATGQLRAPAVTPSERKEQDLFAPIPERVRAGSIEMARVYRTLYALENLVRDFIDTRFTEEDKTSEWFDARASRDMKKKLEDRKKGEEKNQWHVGRNEHPIYYLDFGDLGLLIVNHWSVFKDFFPKQSWVVSRIDEAEKSRNVIAHTNLLSSEEAERLETYLKDWIRQVG